MLSFLLVLVLLGALCTLAGAALAARAWIRLRKTRLAFTERTSREVILLARRTRELESRLGILEKRSSALPARIMSLQQNLTTLGVLVRILGSSLRSLAALSSLANLKSSGSACADRFIQDLPARVRKKAE